ncbi:MAG: threonine/serine exporter family protein [Oscillospiraceae bacterium]|nr:threonine/serine exporter family protein [Oscillospiraceae bacterium]
MDYNTLLDVVSDLGYHLAMCGAETYRIEESVTRIMASYGIESEVFAIPNCLIVSISTSNGKPMTRMRRIGQHGNDLDGVERYSNLSRRICAEKPDPKIAVKWLNEMETNLARYSFPIFLLGNFIGSLGFCLLFGGSFVDSICSGMCGIIVGLVSRLMDRLKVNPFFSTIASAFLMAFAAYGMGSAGIANNTDTVVIGALMLLVPGLLITNAMRDIIFGDTNSGVNRIVQVFLVAAAIALGTGAAWNLANASFGISLNPDPITYPYTMQILAAMLSCFGFSLIFNIHGHGIGLCILGGGLSWAVYIAALHFGSNDIMAYFIAAIICAAYAETMARIRKCPAISYLVTSIFPLIPGAGVYYTTNHLVRGDMQSFSAQGIHTVAIAGAIAVGILMVSTLVHLWAVWRTHRK